MTRFGWMTSFVFFLLSMFLAGHVAGQDAAVCPETTGRTPTPITFVRERPAGIVEQMLTQAEVYLNEAGDTAGLRAAIEGSVPPAPSSYISADVFRADVTGNGVMEVLVNISAHVNPLRMQGLTVFACADSAYVPIAYLEVDDPSGVNIEAVADLNGDNLAEVILRSGRNIIKQVEAVRVYAWNGETLAQIWWTDYLERALDFVIVEDVDAPSATRALLIGSLYSYRDAPEPLSMGDVRVYRPSQTIYAWDGATFAVQCRFFVDRPIWLYQTLHSAEAYRRCDRLDDALMAYERMLDDPNLNRWGSSISLEIPDSVADARIYAGMLEERYLRAFAYYRLVQIRLARGDVALAQAVYDEAHQNYPRGQQGYQYVAMAAAWLEAYEQTSSLDRACEAAENAFIAARGGDDPGIDYDAGTARFPFYFDTGVVYSSNPDDVFAVPEPLREMISIPVCLTG